MAGDVVSSQTIVNGPRNLVMNFTNLSDATGETGVVKVDATDTTLGNQGVAPGIHLKVMRILYDVKGGAVRLRWDATSAQDFEILSGYDVKDFRRFGGLPVPVITGATGKILFTTVGFAANSGYTITLEMIKGV